LLKDLFDVAGLPTRAGSSFLSRVRPTPGESTLVRDLRAAGAAFAAKTHLVEFAAGLTGENRTFGDCPHPFMPDRLAGGSSSGSAALVAAGVAPLAIGTDTGGSVRVPAAFCGLFGYRGIPGDARIADAFPLSSTCDTAGWFTASAADLSATLDALLGPMPLPATEPRGAFLRATDLVPAAPVDAVCHAAARGFSAPADKATRQALLDSWRDAVDAYATIVMHDAHAVHAPWLDAERAHYDPAIWQRLHDAGEFSAEKIAHARSTAAQVRAAFDTFFLSHDFLVLPCAPIPALTKAQCTPETRRAILTFTAPASLAGLPCITVPVPLEAGLTGGLQIIARDANSPVFRWVLAQSRG
jgi:amidase/aspartyl-tRNA(Asn)/glutamyl-tRNA(Gln) amidotransferase subunit A